MIYDSDTTLILIEDNDWCFKVISIKNYNRSLIHKNYNIISRTSIIPTFNEICAYDTREKFDLQKGPSAAPDKHNWERNRRVTIYLKEDRFDLEVKRLLGVFNDRKNQTSRLLKCKSEFEPYDSNHMWRNGTVMVDYINTKLEAHNMKFTGKNMIQKYKKPEQIEQTETDIAREKLFYDLFEEVEDKTTTAALKCLVEAIARTEGIAADKFTAKIIKKVINERCFNEIIYAKLAGTKDLCDIINEGKTATRYVDHAKYILKRIEFGKICKRDDSDEIYDFLSKAIQHNCYVNRDKKKMLKDIMWMFETYNLS